MRISDWSSDVCSSDLLVADIGRQSVRFGLSGGKQGLVPRDVHHFNTADHPTFTSAPVAYLHRMGLENRTLPSALPIAGAVRGDVVNLTGSRGYLSFSGVAAVLDRKGTSLESSH